MAKRKKPLFAAIPLQAIGHRALSASHWQVIAAIAWHDQFGANGIGCYASLKRLAWETGLAETTVSECTGELEGFGFLTKTRHPLNRRTKVYSLIYEGNPRILPETGNCPSTHGAEGTKVPGSRNNRGATLRVVNSQVPEDIEQTGAEYITRSEEKKKPPSGNTESPPRACAPKALKRAAGDGDSASATEERNARAREEKIGGGGDRRRDATRRARLCLGGTHAAGGDDSAVEREEKKEREAKISREALASKAGKDPSEFDSYTWCAWINLNYGYDRSAAADLIIGWLNEGGGDVHRALCEAHARKPADIEAFIAKRLRPSNETKGETE